MWWLRRSIKTTPGAGGPRPGAPGNPAKPPPQIEPRLRPPPGPPAHPPVARQIWSRPTLRSWITSFVVFVTVASAALVREQRSQVASHSGLLEPRGTSTVLKAGGVRDSILSVIP